MYHDHTIPDADGVMQCTVPGGRTRYGVASDLPDGSAACSICGQIVPVEPIVEPLPLVAVA